MIPITEEPLVERPEMFTHFATYDYAARALALRCGFVPDDLGSVRTTRNKSAVTCSACLQPAIDPHAHV